MGFNACISNAFQESYRGKYCRFSFNFLTALLANQDAINDIGDDMPNEYQHYAFAAASDDSLHYGAMRKDKDRPLFEEDMKREVSDLVKSNSIKIMRREELPAGTKPVPAIWSFRRKRAPDWTITKWKARLCPHGGKQVEGENFWETYAPVVTWSTVRLTLILSLITGLKSRQCDFVQAYTQAPLDTDIYMCIPAGFIVENGELVFTDASTAGNSSVYVLCLCKNLYGLRQAGANWFDTLRNSLLSYGFKQSTIDPCLFLRKDIIIVLYVDDCILFARSDAVLDNFLSNLKDSFTLTSAMDVGAFLGIDIRRNAEGFLELTQPGLIGKIVEACGLETESKRHDTPAVTTILRKDVGGDQREHSWKYRTLIGMLTYLSVSSRPDIAFAVHQCARYSVNPMRLHELAVRRIVRYLQGTQDKGYILKPTSSDRNLDCYVDADFAGMWDQYTSDDPNSVKSRTGYVITFAGCPVLWASKLQTEIALSTTEAEYIALSSAMRDLIPMRALLAEFSSLTKLQIGNTVAHSTVFEDNQGCVELANAPKMRPRTKHIAIKYHHFRTHVARGDVTIQWIDTKHQLADIFTKPLAAPLFTSLRKSLLGW
jgi:histone deacetylase 1/2